MAITLIIETGAGLVGANVYSSIHDWLDYASELGQDVVTDAFPISPSPADEEAPDEMKAALIRGTRYVEITYGDRLNGTRVAGRAQSLSFPRESMTDSSGYDIANNEVPIEWKRACWEAAARELETPGSLMPVTVDSERVKQETLGPLSVTYADPVKGGADSYPVVPVIDRILGPLIGGGARSTNLFGTTERI